MQPSLIAPRAKVGDGSGEPPDPPVYVCFYVYFPGGGIGRYTRELAGALGQSPDVTVEVACTPEFQWLGDSAISTWAGLRSISHAVPLVRRLRFLQGQFANPVRFLRHAEQTGAQVVHFSNVNHLSFPYWRGALQASGLKMAVTVHDVRRQKRILNRAWEDRQLKAVYRAADALFVHSEFQAQELVTFADVDPCKVHVVPHGPYSHGTVLTDPVAVRARLGIPADRQVALFFGQIRDEKNLDVFIRALAENARGVHLLVAGAGHGRHRGVEYYEALAGSVGVGERVTFLPRFIPDEEVGDLFAASDWVALPYANSFTSQSGVLNIAAHYERPVLVSSSPVLRETVLACDIGVACEGDNLGSIAEGIGRLSERIRSGHAHQFAEYRRRYSWEENAARTRAVYSRLLN